LDGDQFPDLLLGFFKGGLVYWRNRSLSVSLAELKANGAGSGLLIRPHPVPRGQSFEVALEEGVEFRVCLHDAWGRKVWQQDVLCHDRWLRLDPGLKPGLDSDLEPGSYVLMAHKKNGPPKAARLLIVD